MRNKDFKLLHIIIILYLFLLPLQGQEFYFQHLTVSDGLPHNTISAIIEDKYGFIWVATLEGLCQFDGYKVVNYYSANTDNSLPDQRPVRLYRDKHEDIWISFSVTDQVCKYNYITEDFSRYHKEQLDDSLRYALGRAEGNKTTHTSTSTHLSWQVIDNQLVQTNHKTGEKYTYPNTIFVEGGLTDALIQKLIFIIYPTQLSVGSKQFPKFIGCQMRHIVKYFCHNLRK